MDEFEVTCHVEKGQLEMAWGDDCYSYYTKPNFTERIVRCRDCKWYVKYESMWDTDEWCIRCKDDDCGVFETESDGFCAWGEHK